MATYSEAQSQGTVEVHTYTVDFTNDLPTGGTVTAGTATHIPPSGSVSSVAVTVSNPYVYATLPLQTALGTHYIEVTGTFNNNDISSVRIPIYVLYPSPNSRTGMADVITDLRGMTDTAPDDYQLAGVPYWTDDQLQRILDNHRTELKWVEMTAEEDGNGEYHDYSTGYGNLEQTTGGTAIFFVQDVNGLTVDSAEYTVDYQRGVVSFTEDTAGTAYYVTGRYYDLEGAAADVWRRKQSHYAKAVNFSTKVHSLSRAQLYEHAREMAELFESKGDSGFGTMEVMRSDTDW